MSIFSLRARPDFAVDFGTANLRIANRDQGILYDEASLCCFLAGDHESPLVAAGNTASAMLDRTPAHLKLRRPLCRGVLQDIECAVELLRHAFARVSGRRSFRSARVVIGIPADATRAERSAMLTVASDAGLTAVRLFSEPYAAAVGAGVSVDTPRGTMIVECGAGITEVAVISLGGLGVTRSLRVGGATLTQAIADHLHMHWKFLVGEISAEALKRAYMKRLLDAPDTRQPFHVKGRSLVESRPANLEVPFDDLALVIDRHVMQIVKLIREALGAATPEICQDILTHGLILTGGAATLPDLSKRITEETGLQVKVAERNLESVALGLQALLH